MADGKQGSQEAWRAYLELALGVTEASKKKAQKVAKRLTGRGGATAQQLQAIADNLVSTSLANREALTKLVRFEVDRALGAVGLATAEEVADLNTRIRDLERQLHEEQAKAESPAVGVAPVPGAVPAPRLTEPTLTEPTLTEPTLTEPTGAPARKAAAKKTVAKKTVAKKAVAKKAVAKKAVAQKSVGKKAVAKKAAPDQAVAKSAVPDQAVAKKAVGRQAVAKKVAPPAGMAPE